MTAPVTQDKRCEQIAQVIKSNLRLRWDMDSNNELEKVYATEDSIGKCAVAIAALTAPTPPADMEGAREQVIEGLVAAICDPECPTQFTPLLMDARKMLASVSALQRTDESKGDEVTLLRTAMFNAINSLNRMAADSRATTRLAFREWAKEIAQDLARSYNAAPVLAENGGQADV